MAKSKTPALPWAAHTLVIDPDAKGIGRFSCSACGNKWLKKPIGQCPGFPVYGWDSAPEGLKTQTQLAENRLKPGQVRGLIPYSKSADGYIRLYAESEASPMKERTDAQKAATEKAKAARDKKLTCVSCGYIMPSARYMNSDGRCDDCWKRQREKERQEADTLTAAEAAAALMAKEFVVIDFETTGLEHAKPVSVCIINKNGDILLNTLINPGIPIPEDATRVHGITDEMVASEPTFAEVYVSICEIMHGKHWVGFNLGFDKRVLITACWAAYAPMPRQLGQTDVMPLASTVWGEWSNHWDDYKWVSLEYACWHSGVQVEEKAHSALGDCLRTLGVLKAIAVYIKPRPEAEAEPEPKREPPVIALPVTPVTQKPDYCCPGCGRAVSREEKLFGMDDGRCKACRKT